MRNKNYIFLAALMVGIFISMSVKCGTNSVCIKYSMVKNQSATVENFQSNNLLFIKYAF